jgi:hypothetical protein
VGIPEGVNSACAVVGGVAVVLASKAVKDRPNDPAAELNRAPVLAKNAHPDVAAFIAARAAAMATPDRSDDLGVNGDADPALPLDPAPHPEPIAAELPVGTELPPRPDARPRIVEDPVILGLTRVSRSRLGSRLFTWFFVFIYVLILVQLIVSLLQT